MGQLFFRKPSRHVTPENGPARHNQCVAEMLEPRRMLAVNPLVPAAYGSTIQLNVVDRTAGTGSDPVGVATGFFKDPDLNPADDAGFSSPSFVTTTATGEVDKTYNSV